MLAVGHGLGAQDDANQGALAAVMGEIKANSVD
jgi:hypothetical protein